MGAEISGVEDIMLIQWEKCVYNQIKEDCDYHQITLKVYFDPFAGEQVSKSTKK